MVGAGQFFVDGSVKLQYSSPSRQSIIVARLFYSMLTVHRTIMVSLFIVQLVMICLLNLIFGIHGCEVRQNPRFGQFIPILCWKTRASNILRVTVTIAPASSAQSAMGCVHKI